MHEIKSSVNLAATANSIHLCESVEKRIELVFDTYTYFMSSLRSLSADDINTIINVPQYILLDKKSLKNYDSYIMNDASMFIYDTRIVIIAYGDAPLLRTIPGILEHAVLLGLCCIACQYTRGASVLNPYICPLQSFEKDCNYLNTYIPSMKHKYISNDNPGLYSTAKYIWLSYENAEINFDDSLCVCSVEDYNATPNANANHDEDKSIDENIEDSIEDEVGIMKFDNILYTNAHVTNSYINDIKKVLYKFSDGYHDYHIHNNYTIHAYQDNYYITIRILYNTLKRHSYISIEAGGITRNASILKLFKLLYYMPN